MQSTTAVALTADTASAQGARDRGEYLLCIHDDRSYPVPIPPAGELVIGRGPDAGLSLEDPQVSRAHVQLLRVPDGLRLTDLDSRHGTLLNGEPVREPRLVRSGDVITLGATLLIVRRQARDPQTRNVGDQPLLLRRLAEELARVAQYERELSLLVVRTVDRRDPAALLATIADRMRPIDTVAPLGPHALGVLLPEVDAEDAVAFAQPIAALADHAVAIGIATAPFDGIDADALVSAARAAAQAGERGDVRRAIATVDVIEAGPQRIVVVDPGMARLYELARRIARATLPVLIQGETGVGKELAAAAIHAFSPRASAPFVSMNCAAITETLAESELFGYARGAFSGAVTAKEGLLEAASGGTVFLDEIGELSPAIQAKLLRVLESGELMRVGEVKPRTTDIRIVAATNRDLEREVAAGRFRGDLYFRLGAARLSIPPLRDRPRDIATLAARMLDAACERLGRPQLALSIGTALALFRHEWPGNIRELRHAIEYGAAAAPESARELELWHLPAPLASRARRERDHSDERRDAPPPSVAPPEGGFRPIADEVRELERARMIAALRATSGLQNRAADLIEMPLRTFVTKLKRYAIQPAEWGGT